MMGKWPFWKKLALVLLVMILGRMWYCRGEERVSRFVPYNAFEVPQLELAQWEKVREKFKRLVQTVNTTPFAEAYESKQIVDIVQRILSSAGQGKFHILSVGGTTPFTLED